MKLFFDGFAGVDCAGKGKETGLATKHIASGPGARGASKQPGKGVEIKIIQQKPASKNSCQRSSHRK